MRSIVVSFKRLYKNLKPYFYFSNLVIFIAKVVLFLLTKSFLFIISSFYNLGIGLAKRKIYFNKSNYASVGIFLVMASMSFIVYSIWTIVMHKVVHYDIYSGITIATITFYDIGYSIYGIVKSKSNNNKQNNLLMLVNLASALISLELTQSSILSFTQSNVDNSLYNGIIGILVGGCSLIIGVIILIKSDNIKLL